jgi:hypothetical protein
MQQSTVIRLKLIVTNRRRTPYGFDFVAESSQLPGYSRQGLSAGGHRQHGSRINNYRLYRSPPSATMTTICMRLAGAMSRNIISYISNFDACGRFRISSLRSTCGLCVAYCAHPISIVRHLDNRHSVEHNDGLERELRGARNPHQHLLPLFLRLA